MRERGTIVVLAVLCLVATSGCLGILGDGGDGGDGGTEGSVALQVESVDGGERLYVEPTGGQTLPAGTAINVTVSDGARQVSQVVTLRETVESGTRVYIAGDQRLQASVGSAPGGDPAGGECDVSVSVDTGDRTTEASTTGTTCLGLAGGEIRIAEEPAAINESWRYIYVQPTGSERLPAGTRLNVTLGVEVGNRTSEDTLMVTLNESVSSGTKVYLGADDGGEFGVTVGQPPGEEGAIRPDSLPTTVEITVEVIREGETVGSESFRYVPEEE